MRVTVIGLGGMGRALAGRLLDRGHEVAVWNRTASRAAGLRDRGARVLETPDALDAGTDAVIVLLSDDDAVLDVAAPGGTVRDAWGGAAVVSASTVAPATTTVLHGLYGARFVAAPILGAPHAVESGDARWIVGGDAGTTARLEPLWDAFSDRIDAGPDPARASTEKLLVNQMLLAGLAVVAETVRLGRAAGIGDADLVALLRSSPTVPPALGNRIDGLVDPRHDGWFTPGLAAKDLSLALGLDATGEGAGHPVTEAARAAYRRIAADGWDDVDVTALTELGTRAGARGTDD